MYIDEIVLVLFIFFNPLLGLFERYLSLIIFVEITLIAYNIVENRIFMLVFASETSDLLLFSDVFEPVANVFEAVSVADVVNDKRHRNGSIVYFDHASILLLASSVPDKQVDTALVRNFFEYFLETEADGGLGKIFVEVVLR